MTNLLSFPYDFDNAAWSETDATITANSIASPIGTMTADTALEVATSGGHSVYQIGLTIANGSTYTWSVYVKDGLGRDWFSINAYDSFDRRSYFDVTNGVTGTNAGGSTSSIQSVGSGWYWCTVTRSVVTTSGGIGLDIATADNTFSFLGDITKGLYLWGAQLELGTSATSLLVTDVPMRGLCLSNFGYRSVMVAT